MPYNPVDKKTIGLQIEDQMLRAAFLVSEKGTLEIKSLFEIPLDTQTSEDVKPLYKDPEEKELKELITKHLTLSGLKGRETLVRRLKLKLTKDKDIEETFAFQAEPLLPYPLEGAILDKMVLEKIDGTTQLIIFAAKKEAIERHLALFHDLQIDPEVVSAEALALSAILRQYGEVSGYQFVMEICEKTILFSLLKEGKLFASHTIQTGFGSLYQALVSDRQDGPTSLLELFSTDLNDIDSEHFPHLEKAKQELLQAILWNFLAISKETKITETPLLYILGEGANLKEIGTLIAKTLNLPLGTLKIPIKSCSIDKFHRFAIPIGLALCGQGHLNPSINFRRDELVYATPWRRYQRPLAIFGGLALLLAFALYIFGLSIQNTMQDGLKTRFLALLSLTQKPYEQFEKQYELKYPQEQGDSLKSIHSLSTRDLNERLDFLEKELRLRPESYPLLPNTPKVSDVLAWISTHPSLLCEPKSKETEECAPFTIDSFSYTMVKRPEINKKTEKYQVKIDLEFNTASPRIAREFHDALITPNDFVDPKSEIKWNATKGKYRTSFYLKDKTVYP